MHDHMKLPLKVRTSHGDGSDGRVVFVITETESATDGIFGTKMESTTKMVKMNMRIQFVLIGTPSRALGL